MIEPLRLSYEVACPRNHAFDVWTTRLDSWWPKGHSASGDPDTVVTFEPRLGGRIFERTPKGDEIDWGTITLWDPPRQLGYRWHIARDASEATDVEISFVVVDRDHARIDIVHDGWERLGAEGPAWREANTSGWNALIPAFLDAITPNQPAGDFSEWLDGMRRSVRGEQDSDVPCDGCMACCQASQFIHLEPDETDALAHVPSALRFPAPGLPPGHMLMGHDEHGRCPMLTADGCSIYEHRPRACRTYDCRIFAAVGIEIDEPNQMRVAHQVSRWRFEFPTTRDEAAFAAVRSAAARSRNVGGSAIAVAVRAVMDGEPPIRRPRGDDPLTRAS